MSEQHRIEPGEFGGRITDQQIIVRGEHARTIDLNENAVAALDEQIALFVAKFGREPGPKDPIFFDPDEDEPTPFTEARQAEILAEFEAAAERAGVPNALERLEAMADAKRAIQEEHGISRKIGRNDPCPCGSGLKFKRCHGA